ncbi:MAG: hypothetical protein KIC54_06025 [Clostridium sp.]|nr:hypothetical protein [Clostridium sp.]
MIESEVFKRYQFPIEELRPKIIDTIVEVYGERHRAQIEDRLNNLYINSYVTANDVQNDYNTKKSHFVSMLSVKFLRNIGMDISKETEDEVYKRGTFALSEEHKEVLKQYFGTSNFIDYGKIFSFDDKLINSENDYANRMHKSNRCEILKAMGLEISPENYDEVIQTMQGQECLNRVMDIYKVASECKNEYNQFNEDNKDYIEYLEKVKKYEQELKYKYMTEYATQILPYCDKELGAKIEEALAKNYTSDYRFTQEVDKDGIYIARYGEPLILAFSEDAEEKLAKDNFDSHLVKSDRVKYFKAKGLDLGNNYEDYENSEEAKKLLPDKELVETLYTIKKECDKEMDMEFFLNTGNYEACKRNILAQGIKIQDNFCKEFVENGVTCIVPNVRQDADGNYSLFNIVHLPLVKILPEYKDVQIIHELLHTVESSMKQLSKDEIYFKFGFDEVVEPICKNEDELIVDDRQGDPNEQKRRYELFSENIHQELAIEVTRRLHEKGIYLYGDQKLAKETGSTSYERYNVVTKNFQQEYREEMIDGMMLPTRDGITELVGKENFDRLNATVSEYAELPFYKMMDDVLSKRDTDLTRKRIELANRGKKIVVDMKEYEQTREEYSISVQKIGKTTVHRSLQNKRAAMQELTNDKTKVLEGEQSRNE